MTPTLFSAKRDRVGSVYRDVMLRNKSVWILHLVTIFALSPLALVIDTITTNQNPHNSFTAPLLVTGYVGYFLTLALSCLLPLLLFSFLNNRQALDVIHALPVRRDTLFWGNYLAGLTMLAGPFLLLNGIAGLGLLLMDESNGRNFLRIGLSVLIAVVGCYHLMIFIMVNCGTLFESIVYFGILNIGWPVTVLVFFQFTKQSTFGYVPPMSGLQSDLYSMSALYQLLLSVFDTEFPLLSAAIGLITSILLLLLGYFLYRQRKSEAAGKSFAYLPLFYVSAILISACVGVGFYLLGCYAYEENLGLMAMLGCVFGLLTYFILDTIRNRGLRRVRMTFLVGLPCTLAIAGFCLSCSWTGTFGYETRIPAQSQITSVDVDWLSGGGAYSLPTGTLQTPDEIEKVQEFHRAVVANLDQLKNGDYRTADRYSDYRQYAFDDGSFPASSFGVTDEVTLTYHLRGGRTLIRKWQVPFALTKPLMEAAQSREYQLSAVERLIDQLEDADKWSYCDFEDNLGRRYYSVNINRSSHNQEEQYQLIAALISDLRNRSGGWLVQPDEPVYGRITIGGSGLWVQFAVYLSDRATCTLLDSLATPYDKWTEEVGAEEDTEPVRTEVLYLLPEAVEQMARTDNVRLSVLYRAGENGYFGKYLSEEYAPEEDTPRMVRSAMISDEQMAALREWITPIGIYETAQPILCYEGVCYRVLSGCRAQVEALLAEADSALG